MERCCEKYAMNFAFYLIGKKVEFYIDKRIYYVYTNIKGISIVYTRREKPYGTKDDTREETLYSTNKHKEVGKQSGY